MELKISIMTALGGSCLVVGSYVGLENIYIEYALLYGGLAITLVGLLGVGHYVFKRIKQKIQEKRILNGL